MNSGITHVEQDDSYYYFTGYSGSCYKCNKRCYGLLSPYAENILSNILNHADGAVTLMYEMTDFCELNKLHN